jgi:hypothetical protein
MTGNESSVPPESDLPRLNLGSKDEFLAFIDSFAKDEGTQAVVKWAEKELQPGRLISYGGQQEGLKFGTIYDRSIWRANQSGSATDEALLSPLTDEKSGAAELFGVWAWPLAKEPFLLRIWTKERTE